MYTAVHIASSSSAGILVFGPFRFGDSPTRSSFTHCFISFPLSRSQPIIVLMAQAILTGFLSNFSNGRRSSKQSLYIADPILYADEWASFHAISNALSSWLCFDVFLVSGSVEIRTKSDIDDDDDDDNAFGLDTRLAGDFETEESTDWKYC